MTPGRNDPCPCGSGKKYKKCCLDKVQLAVKLAKEQSRKEMEEDWELGQKLIKEYEESLEMSERRTGAGGIA
jgi:hypothetical protein